MKIIILTFLLLCVHVPHACKWFRCSRDSHYHVSFLWLEENTGNLWCPSICFIYRSTDRAWQKRPDGKLQHQIPPPHPAPRLHVPALFHLAWHLVVQLAFLTLLAMPKASLPASSDAFHKMPSFLSCFLLTQEVISSAFQGPAECLFLYHLIIQLEPSST